MRTKTQGKPEIIGKIAFMGMATTIAMPIMVQNLISTLVSTADTIMLGYVSQNAMAASSLANNVYTLFWMITNGLVTGATVLGAQYWGKKDTKTIEQILGIALRYAMAVGLVFSIVAVSCPQAIMGLFSSDADIIREGASYLRIVGISYVFGALSMGYFAVIRSVEKVLLPSVVFVMSLGINVFLNAVFIFGLFHMPKLGLVGVAIGTATARLFECVVCIVHGCCNRDIRIRLGNIFRRNKVLTKDFLHISIPSVINDGAWALAFSMYGVILGHMGSDAVAANAVANMALNLGAIVTRGFANATTIIVGKALGSGNIQTAKIYARRMVWLTFIFSCIGGLVIIAIRPWVMSLYVGKLTETAIYYLGAMLYMQSYHLIGEGLNTCWICGCFRGGGDTRFGMIVDTLCMWLVAVPFMAIAAYWWKLSVIGVYFVMCLDEFEKMLPVIIHYWKFTWLKNITRENQ